MTTRNFLLYILGFYAICAIIGTSSFIAPFYPLLGLSKTTLSSGMIWQLFSYVFVNSPKYLYSGPFVLIDTAFKVIGLGFGIFFAMTTKKTTRWLINMLTGVVGAGLIMSLFLILIGSRSILSAPELVPILAIACGLLVNSHMPSFLLPASSLMLKSRALSFLTIYVLNILLHRNWLECVTYLLAIFMAYLAQLMLSGSHTQSKRLHAFESIILRIRSFFVPTKKPRTKPTSHSQIDIEIDYN